MDARYTWFISAAVSIVILRLVVVLGLVRFDVDFELSLFRMD